MPIARLLHPSHRRSQPMYQTWAFCPLACLRLRQPTARPLFRTSCVSDSGSDACCGCGVVALAEATGCGRVCYAPAHCPGPCPRICPCPCPCPCRGRGPDLYGPGLVRGSSPDPSPGLCHVLGRVACLRRGCGCETDSCVVRRGLGGHGRQRFAHGRMLRGFEVCLTAGPVVHPGHRQALLSGILLRR